jgi:hypothetical protein
MTIHTTVQKMIRISTVFFLILIRPMSAAPAPLGGPGDIAFTGWNADGLDGFAFVSLVDMDPGAVILFTDNEWDGTAFNSGEGIITWEADALVPAGTIVTIYDTASADISPSSGLVSGNLNLNVSDEGLFALSGSLTSPAFFLAAFSNDGPRGFTTLNGTGLIAGSTAIDFSATAGRDGDIFSYGGPRSGKPFWKDYLAHVADPSNWVFQGGSGDQSLDDLLPDLPFDATPFAVKAGDADPTSVPEPVSMVLLVTALATTFGYRRYARTGAYCTRYQGQPFP